MKLHRCMKRREFITIFGSAAAAAAGGVALHAEPQAAKTQEANIVFLTSDDGPRDGTKTIIDIAERHQVPVTLFMIGENAVANAEHRSLLQRAHESKWITVGNHSDSHCFGHYAHCYRDTKSIVADFEKANEDLGLISRPILARGPGRNVWRLPGMQFDDPAISSTEMGREKDADDALFANGFYLYGWDVEWKHSSHGRPTQTSSTMVEYLTDPAYHGRRPGKVVMLMHDFMMRNARAASELTSIIEDARNRGSRFGKLSEY